MGNAASSVGSLLRDWRRRRRVSQLDLAVDADISTRHLSFVETGRARPSRDMLLRLAERLDVPLRERNLLMVAAGYAPVFSERRMDDPALAAARRVVDAVLRGHEPHPALAVDRHWHLLAANRMVAPLLAGVAEGLLAPPVNVLRLGLHPEGLAPRILNLTEWRAHLLQRLRRQVDATADPALIALLAELTALPVRRATGPAPRVGAADIAVPLRLSVGGETLSLLSTTTVFGTPVDVTLAELAIEAFFPADESTAAALRRIAADRLTADYQPMA